MKIYMVDPLLDLYAKYNIYINNPTTKNIPFIQGAGVGAVPDLSGLQEIEPLQPFANVNY